MRRHLVALLLAPLLWTSCVSQPSFEPLLEPGSFAGWHFAPGGSWRWEGDVLIGSNTEDEPRHGLMISDADYENFQVRFLFRSVVGCSGFYFRVDENDDGSRVGVSGFQAEIDPSFETGGLYETRGRGWVVRPDPALVESTYRPGEWSEMIITAFEDQIEVRVNDTVTARLANDSGRRKGKLAMQLHGGEDVQVEFRELRVRELLAWPR